MYYGKYEAIIAKIKQVRKKNNKTQEEVAIYLGITKQAYFRYEKGTRKMDVNTIFRIANFFNLPDNFFLNNNVTISHSSDEIIFQLIEYFVTLSNKLEFNNLKDKESDNEHEQRNIKNELVFIHSEMLETKKKITDWLNNKTNSFDFY